MQYYWSHRSQETLNKGENMSKHFHTYMQGPMHYVLLWPCLSLGFLFYSWWKPWHASVRTQLDSTSMGDVATQIGFSRSPDRKLHLSAFCSPLVIDFCIGFPHWIRNHLMFASIVKLLFSQFKPPFSQVKLRTALCLADHRLSTSGFLHQQKKMSCHQRTLRIFIYSSFQHPANERE